MSALNTGVKSRKLVHLFAVAALTVIGRFDFARMPQGLNLLDFNSDMPTGVVEAYLVNGKVCVALGMERSQ
jgi:glutathionylspermidine synthase